MPGKDGKSADVGGKGEVEDEAKRKPNSYRIGGHRVAFPEGKKPFGAQFA